MFIQGYFEDILLRAAMGVIFDNLEILRFWPVVDTVFFADHEGPFSGLAVFIEGLFGIAMGTISDVDITSAFAEVG